MKVPLISQQWPVWLFLLVLQWSRSTQWKNKHKIDASISCQGVNVKGAALPVTFYHCPHLSVSLCVWEREKEGEIVRTAACKFSGDELDEAWQQVELGILYFYINVWSETIFFALCDCDVLLWPCLPRISSRLACSFPNFHPSNKINQQE